MDNFEVLGDPHLGRKFRTGVPLDRVGEREAMVWEEFEQSLMGAESSFHITMGDLFDKFIVPPEVVLRAAQAYLNAAEENRGCLYIILLGNHDVSRDTSKASSFDLFTRLVGDHTGISVVKDKPKVWDGLGFVPYTPFGSTEDLVKQLPDNLDVVFGHWDIQDWGGENVIPTQLLKEKGITLAYSGHDHLARREKRHGVDIIVTGSMQPYSHAEDDTGEWYITVPLDQLASMNVSDKNVRVLLAPGEDLPAGIDCLSLTAKRVASEEEEIEVDTEEFESLDLGVMLGKALKDLSCHQLVMKKFEEVRDEG